MNSWRFIEESLKMVETEDYLKQYFDEVIAHHPWETLIPNFEKAVREGRLSIEKVVRLSVLLGVFIETKRRGV